MGSEKIEDYFYIEEKNGKKRYRERTRSRADGLLTDIIQEEYKKIYNIKLNRPTARNRFKRHLRRELNNLEINFKNIRKLVLCIIRWENLKGISETLYIQIDDKQKLKKYLEEAEYKSLERIRDEMYEEHRKLHYMDIH